MEKKWDLFISHASEDKESFVRPLANELVKRSLNVWYDEFVLEIGDSLRQSIEKGITDSNYGLIVLSHNFFKKNWPQKELNALFSKDIIKDKSTLIPIWHQLDIRDVLNYSPFLADIVALNSSGSEITEIAQKLVELVLPQSVREEDAISKVNSFKHFGNYDKKRMIYEIYHRLDILANYEEEVFEHPLHGDENWDKFVIEKDLIRRKHGLPKGLYEIGEPYGKSEISAIKKEVRNWIYKKNSDEQIQEFADKLFFWHMFCLGFQITFRVQV